MGSTYNKERHLPLTLHGLTKTELKAIAHKDNRNVNNFINDAIQRRIKEMQK